MRGRIRRVADVIKPLLASESEGRAGSARPFLSTLFFNTHPAQELHEVVSKVAVVMF